MKTAVLFLVVGVAVAIPQNFYFYFPVKDNPSDHPARFRTPWNAEPSGPLIYDDPELDDDSIQPRNRFLVGSNFLFQSLFQQRPVITHYEYTATVTTTVIHVNPTTCISSTAFPLDALLGTHIITPCPILRNWNDPLVEHIAPSIVEQVMPTVAQLSAEESAQEMTIDSSKDETVPSDLQRRQMRFFNNLQQPSTTLIKTDYVSTYFSVSDQTISLTNLGFTNIQCLPQGIFVCPSANRPQNLFLKYYNF